MPRILIVPDNEAIDPIDVGNLASMIDQPHKRRLNLATMILLETYKSTCSSNATFHEINADSYCALLRNALNVQHSDLPSLSE